MNSAIPVSLQIAGPAAAVVLAAAVTLAVSPHATPLLLALVIAVFVVPHGALDALGLRGAVQWGLYICLAAAVALGWWAAPVASMLGFVAVTIVHFAHGDSVWMPRGGPVVWRAVPRGVLPMALPGVFHATEYAEALQLVLLSVGSSVAVDSGALGAVCMVAAAAALTLGLVSATRMSIRHDLTELVALVMLFALASPMVAIGAYLALWHGWRHMLFVSQLHTGSASVHGVFESLRGGALVAAVSVLGFLAMIWTAAQMQLALSAVLGPTLALLSAVTVPHVLVVFALERGWLGMRPAAHALAPSRVGYARVDLEAR